VKRPKNLVPLGMLVLVVMFLIFGSAVSSASDIFVAQNATGNNNGADCQDAYSAAWFGTTANWGSNTGQIGPGTTVHLCGTISTPLTFQGSGTSGKPITIFFESGAAIDPSTCSTGTGNSCLSVAGKSNIIVDGGSACGWINHAQVSCNGTIENSTAQPSGSNFAIDASNCTNCEFRNLNIGPLYTKSSGGTDPSGDIRGIQAVSSAGTGTWLVHNNILHDTSSAIVYVPSGGSDPGPQAYNNVTFNINSSMDISNNSNGTLIGALVHDNHFGATANWDNTGCPDHHNALHEFAQGTGSNSGTSFHNNLIDGNWGDCATGGLFFEGPSGTVQVFNNYWNPTYIQMNNGIVGLDGSGFTGSVLFANNTVIGTSQSGDVCMSVGSGSGATALTMENNILSTCNTLINTATGTTYSKIDHNTYGGNSSSTPWANGSAGHFYSFAQWQTLTSGESNSTFNSSTSYVKVNTDGTLQSGSPAIGAAVNLTSFGMAPLDSDLVENPRPSTTGTWDVGARNFASSSATPAAPVNLAGVVQ
jgi:hypothetical protein